MATSLTDIDRKAAQRWRDSRPQDFYMTDEEIVELFGETVSFASIRLNVSVNILVEAVKDEVAGIINRMRGNG